MRVLWDNFSIRTKFLLQLLSVTVITISIISGYYIFESSQTLKKELISGNLSVLDKSMLNVTKELDTIVNSANTLANYTPLINAFSINYEDVFQLHDAYEKEISPIISIMEYPNPYMNHVKFYIDNDSFHFYNIMPIDEARGEEWFDSICSSRDYYITGHYNNTISIISKTVSSQSGCIIYVPVNINRLFKDMVYLDDSLYIIKFGDEIVGTFPEQLHITDTSDTFLQYNGNHYTKLAVRSDKYDLEIIKYVNNSHLVIDLNATLWKFCFIIFLLFTAIFFLSLMFSKSITKKIKLLNDSMNIIEQGNFNLVLPNTSKDEVGQLTDKFNVMTQKINQLIKDIVQNSIRNKELEVKLLSAQIKPHFLYNTLSTISWMATFEYTDEIKEIVENICAFYRTSLNNGGNFTTVKDELLNIKSYITLEQFMHPDLFDVSYEIEDDVLSRQIPNFILQPFVENSIVHAFNKMRTGKGGLVLKAVYSQNEILFTISDNGIGIEPDMLSKLLVTSNSKNNYGIYNVNKRLELLYGAGYPYIQIESQILRGTCVTIRIPDCHKAD